MTKNPELFKKKVKETLIKHAQLLKNIPKKVLTFLITETHFLLEASRAGADVMADGRF